MTPELKAKWIAALRSGTYVQAHTVLRKPNDEDNSKYAYCCLGVLCNIIAPHAWEPSEYHQHKFSDGEELSREACEELGLKREIVKKLITLNDGEDTTRTNSKSFAEIAKYLEETL